MKMMSLLLGASAAAAATAGDSPAATPSAEQLAYMESGLTMFIHFGVNTFGNETHEHNCDPADVQKRTPAAPCISASAFDPEALDTDQWARVARDMGAYAAVLTVKHEGGFCLWPTNQSAYSIRASPFGKTGRDIVAEFVASCRKHGLRPGFYIAPTEDGWTMQQQPKVNSSAFVAKELAMFRELLTGRYGDIERTWWDHYPFGCGMSAPGGFRSSCPKASFPGAYAEVIAAVRSEAPHLLITNGPDA